MVFSVREGKDLFDKAAANAWVEVEKTLASLAAAGPGKNPQLISVSYDPLPGESVIEELPEQPKSSRPQAVEAAVRLKAIYRDRE